MRRLWLPLVVAVGLGGLAGCGGGDAGPVVEVGSMTLHQAAYDPALLEHLHAIITSGADLDARDERGLTALHYAVASDNGEAVRLLVLAGADTSVTDPQGRTPQALAEQANMLSAIRVFDRLDRIP